MIECNNIGDKHLSKKDKFLASLPYAAIFYGAFILPIERGKEGCRKPNAIEYRSDDGAFGSVPYCTDSKVNTGLIYDSLTKQAITTDTTVAGQSFQCLCSGLTSSGYAWKKANKVEDNPGANPSLTTIVDSYGGVDSFVLEYRTHYRLPENLYCITRCSVKKSNSDSYTYTIQYQMLKIR
jgi:hypothetical protein